MKTNKETETKPAWYWLTDTERQVLLDFSPEAEATINREFSEADLTEETFYPYTPVGRNARDQGCNDPWLPAQHTVVNRNARGLVTITHPQDHSFTKHEERSGMKVRVRHKYILNFHKLALACMAPELRNLDWSIYNANYSNGTQHIYLNCKIPAVNGDKVSLYVPTSYFRTRNYSEVESFHDRVAVGYYRGKGFRVSDDQLTEWQRMTAAATTCNEAKLMRAIVETEAA